MVGGAAIHQQLRPVDAHVPGGGVARLVHLHLHGVLARDDQVGMRRQIDIEDGGIPQIVGAAQRTEQHAVEVDEIDLVVAAGRGRFLIHVVGAYRKRRGAGRPRAHKNVEFDRMSGVLIANIGHVTHRTLRIAVATHVGVGDAGAGIVFIIGVGIDSSAGPNRGRCRQQQ